MKDKAYSISTQFGKLQESCPLSLGQQVRFESFVSSGFIVYFPLYLENIAIFSACIQSKITQLEKKHYEESQCGQLFKVKIFAMLE